jgi:hypothetical protein
MLWEIIALLVVICAVIFAFMLIKNVLFFIINSVIGFFALFGFNYLFNAGVTINIWSVLITAVGGIVGFIVIVGCHYLGWLF